MYANEHIRLQSSKTNGLQETEAYSTIGINPDAGVVYFLNRLSPAKAAEENWKMPEGEVRKEWLPALASSSDHAWRFWNRANAGNLGGIKKIFSCMITNEITLALIDEALKTYPLGPGEERPNGVQKWPGTTLLMRYNAAQALLGESVHSWSSEKTLTYSRLTQWLGRWLLPRATQA